MSLQDLNKTKEQAPVVPSLLISALGHLNRAIENEDWDEAKDASNALDLLNKGYRESLQAPAEKLWSTLIRVREYLACSDPEGPDSNHRKEIEAINDALLTHTHQTPAPGYSGEQMREAWIAGSRTTSDHDSPDAYLATLTPEVKP